MFFPYSRSKWSEDCERNDQLTPEELSRCRELLPFVGKYFKDGYGASWLFEGVGFPDQTAKLLAYFSDGHDRMAVGIWAVGNPSYVKPIIGEIKAASGIHDLDVLRWGGVMG
jgi:hypothetical protein